MKTTVVAFAALLFLIVCGVAAQNIDQRGQTAVPTTPVPVRNILYARPFSVQLPYINTWSSERTQVSTGMLVVLEVDPAYVDRRDTAINPVLYAGEFAVIPLNHGNESGRVIGIIPGNVDLATAPIWFGSPELPERITREVARSERARAERAGMRPFPAQKIADVRQPAVAVTDVGTLLREVAAELVSQYSPQEKELADAWRLPVAKAPPRKP